MIYFQPQKDSGNSLGSAIGEGLAALAQGKSDQLVRNHQRKNTKEALLGFGFSPEKAEQLSHFDPQILREVVKNERKKPSMAYTNAIESLTSGGKQSQQRPMQQQQSPIERLAQQQEMPGFAQPSVEESILNNLRNSQHRPLLDQSRGLQNLQQHPGEELMRNLMQQQGQVPQMQQPQDQQQSQLMQRPEQTRIDYSAMSPEEAKEVYRLERDRRKEEEELARNRFKDTKEFRKEILAKAAQARENLESLDRLEDLNKEGNLNSNAYMEFLKGVGLDIPALMTADSQEFNKITSNFIRGAKAIFGSRVTEKELQYYLQTIPQLSNTPEGRQRVILNLKKLHHGEQEMLKSYKQILQENKGVPPNDIAEQVEERSAKKLDAIARQFKKDVEKSAVKGQSPLAVGAASLAGKAVGRIPAAALGAVGGAALGSRVGPVGAIPGAIIGGLAGLSGVKLPLVG